MKGLLLDVYKQEVREIECEPDIHDWYKLLNCDIVEMPERSIAGKSYTIICDEEGLLKEQPIISAINNNDVMLVGSLLIFNTDIENCDVTDLTEDDIEHIKKHVKEVTAFSLETGEYIKRLVLTDVDY